MGRKGAVKKLTMGLPARNCFLRFGRTYAFGRSLPAPRAQGYDLPNCLMMSAMVFSMMWFALSSNFRKTNGSAKVLVRHW